MRKLNGFVSVLLFVNLACAYAATNRFRYPDTTRGVNQVCSAPGAYAVESNCQLYYECSATGYADGSLYAVTKSCAKGEAFDWELQRCSIDISSCRPPVKCLSKGVIPDPESVSSYYFCQPRFSDDGFHIFRINCRNNEVFDSSWGKCLPNVYGTVNNENLDFTAVRWEIKQLKQQYKATIKQEQAHLKAEKTKYSMW